MTIKEFNLVNIVVCIYILGISLLPDGNVLIKIFRLLILGVFILYILKNRKVIINRYIKWSVLFSLFCFTSIYWAESRATAFSGALTVLWNSICTSCIVIIISADKRYFYNAIKTIFFSSIVYGALVFVKYGYLVFINQRYIEKISANTVGIRASIGILLALIIISQSSKYKKLYILGSGINILWIILSASRKSLLILIISLSIYMIFKNKNVTSLFRNGIFVIISLFAIYYCIMNVSFLYEFIGNRIETMIKGILGSGKTDGSTMFRMELINWGKEWFYKKPILGYGIDNYRYLLGFKNTWAGTEGTYAHNNFIELLVSGGLVGMIMYYWIYLDTILTIFKEFGKRNIKLILGLGLILGLLINEYGLVTYSNKYIQLIIGVLWTLVIYEKNILTVTTFNGGEMFIE